MGAGADGEANVLIDLAAALLAHLCAGSILGVALVIRDLREAA